ncbi:MAG: hypothetical protein VX971_07630 [Actinomycetota bacterium]|nr:hypothetical protein [Actinomycetota bacterium]MEC9270249.1 hypothetical protein [Actinomycetota bacterium]MEC9339488.1 hypothetical protein [Actinomycetota bacterium]
MTISECGSKIPKRISNFAGIDDDLVHVCALTRWRERKLSLVRPIEAD